MSDAEETSAGTGGTPVPPPTAHTQIGRYKILRELGRGAMGVVYESVDPKIGRKVALKVLHDVPGIGAAEVEEFRSRFFREARTAGMLSHRNIVVIHDVDHDEQHNITYMAMELLKGQSIRDILRGGVKFTTEQAMDVIIQVAEGLDHAHRQGIVHRDVKPDNLMLLEDGTVKITDFGIAKISTSNLTRAGQFIGTPNYMSPEQVIGHVIDGRSDLFSLGIILYELLTGEKPFMGSSLTTITYQIVNVDPIEPSKIRPGIPKIFDQVVAKLLKKAPDDRFATGKEVAESLRGVRDAGAASILGATQTGARGVAASGPSNSGDATQVSAPGVGGGGGIVNGGMVGSSATLSASSGPGAAPAAAPAASGGMERGSSRKIVAMAAVAITLLSIVMLVKILGGKGAADPEPSGASAALAASGALGASGSTEPLAASGAVAATSGASGAASGVSGATGSIAPGPTGTSASAAITLPPKTASPTKPPPKPTSTSASSGTAFVLPPRAGAATTAASSATTAAASTASGSATVNLSLTHKLKSGTLVATVDGRQVLSLDLGSADRKRGRDTASGTFEAPDGRHEIKLCLTSPEIEDGAKCSYKQASFVMNRNMTIRAEHGKPTVGKHWLNFTIE